MTIERAKSIIGDMSCIDCKNFNSNFGRCNLYDDYICREAIDIAYSVLDFTEKFVSGITNGNLDLAGLLNVLQSCNFFEEE